MARVDPKAILEGRKPGRAPVGLILGMIGSSVCVLVVLGIDALNGAPFLVGFALAILPVPLLVALVLALDRLEPEPRRDLVFAFMWGAGVAVLGALLLNTAGYELLTKPVFGQRGELVTAAVGAPLVEESLKGAVLFGFLWFRRAELDGPTDGIIYAAMVAIGFAMMENVGYYVRALHQHNLEAVFIMRGLISPFGHPLFTSMTGLGVAYAALNRGAARVAGPVAGLCGAMILHGAWNFSTAFGLKGLAIAYGIDFCVLITLIVIVVRERHQTVRLIHHYLLPAYGATGLVTPQDVQMLGNLGLRRRARQWARMAGGVGAGRAMADYQLAATELVLLHQRAARGIADPAWFERRRADLLNLMHAARQAFQVRNPRPLLPPWAGPGQSGFLRPGPPGRF